MFISSIHTRTVVVAIVGATEGPAAEVSHRTTSAGVEGVEPGVLVMPGGGLKGLEWWRELVGAERLPLRGWGRGTEVVVGEQQRVTGKGPELGVVVGEVEVGEVLPVKRIAGRRLGRGLELVEAVRMEEPQGVHMLKKVGGTLLE